MLPLFPWDPKTSPLCYPILFPYGENAYGLQIYPLKKGTDKKKDFLGRLKEYGEENRNAAEEWEVKMDANALIGPRAAPLSNSDLSLDATNSEKEVVARNTGSIDDFDNFNGSVSLFSQNSDNNSAEEYEEEIGIRLLNEVTSLTLEETVDFMAQQQLSDRPVSYETAREGEECEMTAQQLEKDLRDILSPADYPIEPVDEENVDEFEPGDKEVTSAPQSMDGTAEDHQGAPILDEKEEEMEDGKNKRGPRQFASLRQYIIYIYQRRKLINNRFTRTYKLCQPFLVDNFMRMINGRNIYYRKKAVEYMTSTAAKMLEAKQRLADRLNLGITIGAQFTVPHTVPGSPRWLQQKFENAVAMTNALGKPDLFVTAAANVKWPEIAEKIPKDETWADHPFLVNEVFKKKLDQLMDLITGKGIDKVTKKKKKGLFGAAAWYTYSIEFQQRGPPHAHMVISLKKKPKTVLDVDKVCQAVLPKNNARLRKLVEQFMIHKPCEGDKEAYCRANIVPSHRMCAKGFPKDFNDGTKLGDRHYPELERPDDGEKSSRDRKADNRYVVPYNEELLSFFSAGQERKRWSSTNSGRSRTCEP